VRREPEFGKNKPRSAAQSALIPKVLNRTAKTLPMQKPDFDREQKARGKKAVGEGAGCGSVA
jgi:hypothetical protein